jgi:hypothetical protein
MTEPQPLWPHPPRRPGSKIRHKVLCSRQGEITTATRRAPSGRILEVEQCSECQADDYPERLMDQPRLDPTSPDAA